MSGSPPDLVRLARLARGVGALSLWLGAVGLVRPRAMAALLGVHAAAGDEALPVLVRLIAARNAMLGLALLTGPAPDMQRTGRLWLALTAADAAAVVAGTRQGELARRSSAASLLVLGANVAIVRAAERAARRG